MLSSAGSGARIGRGSLQCRKSRLSVRIDAAFALAGGGPQRGVEPGLAAHARPAAALRPQVGAPGDRPIEGMARGREVGLRVRIERHDGHVAALPAQAAERRSLGVGGEVDAVRGVGRVHGEPRFVVADRHDTGVQGLEAPLRVMLQRIVDDADVVHRAVILGTEHDVGVVAAFMLDAHGRLDPVEAVVRGGVELAQARVFPAVGAAAACPQALAVELEVGVEAMKSAAVGIAPQIPGVA